MNCNDCANFEQSSNLNAMACVNFKPKGKAKTCEKFVNAVERVPEIVDSADYPGMYFIRARVSRPVAVWLTNKGEWIPTKNHNATRLMEQGCYSASRGIAQAIIDRFCQPKDVPKAKATGHAYPCYYRDGNGVTYRAVSPAKIECWQDTAQAEWFEMVGSEQSLPGNLRLLLTVSDLLADLKAEKNLPAHLQKLVEHIESGGEKKLGPQDWLDEYYPESAQSCVNVTKDWPEAERKVALIAHALRKWEGLVAEVLEKYGLEIRSHNVWTKAKKVLYIAESSCSLCLAYMLNNRCAACPISEKRCMGGHNSPWNVYCRTDNPEPMIALLKKALAEAQGKEKPRVPKERRVGGQVRIDSLEPGDLFDRFGKRRALDQNAWLRQTDLTVYLHVDCGTLDATTGSALVSRIYKGPDRRLVTKQPEAKDGFFANGWFIVRELANGDKEYMDSYGLWLHEDKYAKLREGCSAHPFDTKSVQAALEAYYESTGQLEKSK